LVDFCRCCGGGPSCICQLFDSIMPVTVTVAGYQGSLYSGLQICAAAEENQAVLQKSYRTLGTMKLLCFLQYLKLLQALGQGPQSPQSVDRLAPHTCKHSNLKVMNHILNFLSCSGTQLSHSDGLGRLKPTWFRLVRVICYWWSHTLGSCDSNFV
jgi:hypothetical protein